MTQHPLARVVSHLRRLAGRAGDNRASDACLLDRFVTQRDEAAFELLIWRHGPMVWGVCRRVLRDVHEAEDAFQAALLALARKAGSIGKSDSLSSWLYKVAYRAALRARSGSAKRARFETLASPGREPSGQPESDLVWRELRPVLDEEISRLPEKYRIPVVLCYLQGKTNEDAAQCLHCPIGTVKTRLSKARALLCGRLTRRGLNLSVTLLTTVLGEQATNAMPMVPLGPIINAALLATSGSAAWTGVLSPNVALLTHGVLKAMLCSKLKMAASVIFAVAVIGTGAGAWSYQALAQTNSGMTSSGRAPSPDLGIQAEAKPRTRPGQSQAEIVTSPDRPMERRAKVNRDDAKPTADQPVALIYDNTPISRQELGDYLIARFGQERLELLINRLIVENACQARGIHVTDAEVEAHLKQELKDLGDLSAQHFTNQVLKPFNKTLYEWKEDVIRPKLLLSKLCRPMIAVTEQDLANAFEARYGPKVQCRMIAFAKGDKHLAETWAKISQNETDFALHARQQFLPALASKGGEIPPIHKHFSDARIEAAAFRLKLGQITPLMEMPDGTHIVLKCDKHLPADVTKRFDGVRPDLQKELTETKLAQRISEHFAELRKQARPRLLMKSEK